MAEPSFEINANAFAKCSPAISTNIKQCGSVTACSAKSLEADELDDVYLDSGAFRLLEPLFHHDMEIKMCEATQNTMYEFLMANKVNLSKRVETRRVATGLYEVAPFIMARQFSPINDAYWKVSDGVLSGAITASDTTFTCNVISTTNIPAVDAQGEVRAFPTGLRVFIDCLTSGGAAGRTTWEVTTATQTTPGDNTTATLVLKNLNLGSNLDPDKIAVPLAANVHEATKTGILMRGTPNVSDYEKWCYEMPAYLNWKNVPFWIETERTSMCWSELYDKYRKLLLSQYGNNTLYEEFFDLDETQKNKQLAADWMKRKVWSFFRNPPINQYQNVNQYRSLDEITAFDPSDVGFSTSLNTQGNDPNIGAGGGKCIGRRANSVGVYEQLAECNRVFDMLGSNLVITDLAVLLYKMMRVREGQGQKNAKVFDLFMDSVYAEYFNRAMISYYNDKAKGLARFNISAEGTTSADAKKANFGFYYRTYTLSWPQGVTINVITHEFFDDYITALNYATSVEAPNRMIWILDFAGIYPGILATNRTTPTTGNLDLLAKIAPSYACVMKVNTEQRTNISVTSTTVVECPAGSAIIENLALEEPDATGAATGIFTADASTPVTTTTYAS